MDFKMDTHFKKVLLVDDDLDYAGRLQRVLGQNGFLTHIATNGASGLLAAHSEHPDLIVLDAEMPVMNGYQVLQVLRSDPDTRQMVVVFLTPPGEEAEIVRGWQSGADSCLPHGIGSGDVLLLIRRFLGRGAEGHLSLAN
jgi:DNA-binding response OmpR family regulator